MAAVVMACTPLEQDVGAVGRESPRGASEQGLTSISFRGSSRASGKGITSLAIPAPAGLQVDDVVLARLTNRNNVSAVLTPPAGWTLLRSDQSASAIKTWVLYKVATASEPSSYTFTLDLASYFAGSLVAYSGVDPLNPIDTHGGQKNGDSATFTTPALTTSSADGLAVWFGSQVWTGAACPSPGITPPTGFTVQEDTCLVSSSTGLLLHVSEAALGAAGMQPPFVGGSAFAHTNTAEVVALRATPPPPAPGVAFRGTAQASALTATSLTIAAPAGVEEADLLLARLSNRNQVGATLTPPAGWTLLRSDQSSTQLKSWVFYKVATASEPSSYEFGISLASNLAGSIDAFSGVDPVSPIDTHSGQKNGTTSAFDAPLITTTSGNGLVVWFGSQIWAGSTCPASPIAPPSGFTESFDTCLVSSSAGLLYDAAWKALGAAGVQPAFNGTSPYAQTNTTQVVALRPIQPPPPPAVAFRSAAQASALAATRLTLPAPAGVAADDVLLARLSNRNQVSATLTPPAGWTFLRSDQSSSQLKSWVFYKVATASEPASYEFGISLASNLAGSIDAFSGADPASPIDTHSGQKNGTTSAFDAPALTTASAGGLAVWFGSQLWAGSTCPASPIVPPADFTESFETCLVSTSTGLIFNSAWKVLGEPGVQPAFNGSSPYANTNTAQVVALRAASAPACTAADNYVGTWVQQGTVVAPEIVEPSGLAASRVVPDVLYVHNEDTTAIVAISTLNASTVGVYDVGNVTPADWEDVASGPCPAGSCIFMGDIGRASANFPTPPNSFAVYRIPEPDLANGQTTGTLAAEAFPFVYPDSAKDAEALMVHPVTGDIYVITKSGSGASKVYKFPTPLPAPGTMSTLVWVADLQLPVDPNDVEAAKATSAAVHPCANRFLVRTYRRVYEFRAAAGQGFESAFAATPVTLTDTQEGQGEAIEYDANGASYYTMSETPSPFRLKRVSRL
ncbi:cell wall anchor protein [Pyxidicoccus trucidator]|uniref:cell wall anchor protein n=1 Tax=Pyxidicoccus trucidator TaxID=2709662 RepID=UPI001F07BA1C|nr:cell wall anchor protein [Pyxidicoccus trucidator]